MAACLALLAVAIHVAGRVRFGVAASRLEGVIDEGLRFDQSYLEKAPIAEDDNAAHHLLAAATALDLPPLAIDRPEWPAGVRRPEAEVVGGLREQTAPYAARLARLADSVPLPESSFGVDYRNGVGAVVPSVMPLLWARGLLEIEARLALLDGDREHALRSLRTLRRIGSVLEAESFIIFSLVGVASQGTLASIVRDLLEEERWAGDAALLEALLELFPEAEAARVLDLVVVDAVAAASAWRHGVWSEWHGREVPWPPSRLLLGHWSAANCLASARHAVDYVARPYAQWERADAEAPRSRAFALMELTELAFDEIAWQGGDWRHRVASILTSGGGSCRPAYAESIRKHQLAAAQRQLVRAALRLRLAVLSGRTYESARRGLAELDAPDPFTGRPPRLRAEPDGSVVVELDGARELELQARLRYVRDRHDRARTAESMAREVFRIELPPGRAG